MENKLQELTQKLYDEGLAKGRQQADSLVAEAQAKAEKILSEAKYEADRILRQARSQAEDLHKNTLTELSLAGKQALAELKSAITELVVLRTTGDSVAQANLDPQFVKEILSSVASNWSGSAGEVSLKALLPAARKESLDTALAAGTQSLLDKGLEIEFSDKVKSGFQIGPREGGYYISFSDESFDALLGDYLRPKVKELLFSEQE